MPIKKQRKYYPNYKEKHQAEDWQSVSLFMPAEVLAKVLTYKQKAYAKWKLKHRPNQP